jgi:purine-binding chemotaxis protein CheW
MSERQSSILPSAALPTLRVDPISAQQCENSPEADARAWLGAIGMQTLLLCRVSSHRIGLPIDQVVETMRPLPAERLSGAPDFVRGVSVIRGVAVPVVDVGRLVAGEASRAERFVIVRAAQRTVALAVDRVDGLCTLPPESFHALPPLLRSSRAEIIEAIGRLDRELLLMLRGAHLLPDDVWRLTAETVGS